MKNKHDDMHKDNQYLCSDDNSEWVAPQKYNLILEDKYCPIYGAEHPNSDCHRYFEIRRNGIASMKCTNEKCIGKRSPEQGILITLRQLKAVFNIDDYET